MARRWGPRWPEPRTRRVAAEEAARRIPVTMLFPLVMCVLPAFALLTVVPILAATLGDLRLPAGPATP